MRMQRRVIRREGKMEWKDKVNQSSIMMYGIKLTGYRESLLFNLESFTLSTVQYNTD